MVINIYANYHPSSCWCFCQTDIASAKIPRGCAAYARRVMECSAFVAYSRWFSRTAPKVWKSCADFLREKQTAHSAHGSCECQHMPLNMRAIERRKKNHSPDCRATELILANAGFDLWHGWRNSFLRTLVQITSSVASCGLLAFEQLNLKRIIAECVSVSGNQRTVGWAGEILCAELELLFFMHASYVPFKVGGLMLVLE